MNKCFLSEEIIIQDTPPGQICLIRYGKTKTTKGEYFFDEESAAKVLSRYESRGLHLCFDYNHLSIDPKNEDQGKAAGWFDLELRQDGLYAVNIQWTPKAAGMLANKEFLYISPAIVLDDKQYVVRLINVALTNLPATDNLEPLTRLEEETFMQTEVKLLNSEKRKLTMEEMKHLTLAKKHLKCYAVHASKAMLESEDEDLKKMYKGHHGDMMKMAEEVKTHMKRIDPAMLDDDTTEPDGDESPALLSESLKELTGKDKIVEQLMVITAYKDSMSRIQLLSEQNQELEGQVKLLKDKAVEAEKILLVDQAITGPVKKLFPKQRTWALSQTIEQLNAYLEVTPVINLNTKYEQPVVSLVEEEVLKLTDMDKKIIEAMEAQGISINQEKYLADKKKNLVTKK